MNQNSKPNRKTHVQNMHSIDAVKDQFLLQNIDQLDHQDYVQDYRTMLSGILSAEPRAHLLPT